MALVRPSPVRARINSRFKLSETSEHGQDQAAVCRRGVGPCIAERAEASAAFADLRERVEKVAGRAGEAVEPRHHEHVAVGKLAHDAAQLDAVRPRAACRLAVDLGSSGGAQLLHLRVNALAVRRYPCIAVNHRLLMHVIFAQEKGFAINGPDFEHNS